MPIDVLLTYPADGLRLFQSMIPLGLVSTGTVLKEAGYNVHIIDFNHYHRDYRRELLDLQPKVIGIGGTTPSRRASFLTAQLSKEVLPDVPVVYGGVHASFTAPETLRDIVQIDYVILGEGEYSFLSLCNHLTGKNNGSIATIPGLARRNNGEILVSRSQRIKDLSVLPVPDRDLLPHAYNMEMDFIGGQGDLIITSRGCPAACNFCAASRMFPGGAYYRNMDSIGTEIEYLLSRRQLTGLKIFDSTFTANREHALMFCNLIRQFRLSWECEIRADTVDYDLLKVMRDCGCYYINIGMETTSPTHLKRIAKGISPQQVLKVLAMCRALNIKSKVFFTFGHFGQTYQECLEDIQFMKKNKPIIDFFAVTVGMRIYPGTRLEKTCRESGNISRNFLWVKSAINIKNLLIFEPGDMPILFQKGLGPGHMLLLIINLFFKKLIGTEMFLLKMTFENTGRFITHLYLHLQYTWHRTSRFLLVLKAKAFPSM
jgi:anaerobic magnesium-protoporphyrin IX monomethyl ester cyclase